MKSIFFILLLLGNILVIPAYSEKVDTFGYQIHPEMLLENSEGIIQIFVQQNNLMIPKTIKDFQVSSTDNSIIKIQSITQNENGYSIDVKIQAIKAGTANIAVAASGFGSQEIPITVYTSNNHATQILMKITPDDFPIDGPRFGYVSVELATTGDLPTKAEKDISIKITSPNKNTIQLENEELVIPKGAYYAIEKFQIVGSGDAMIFAESDGLKKVSEKVHVRKPSEPLQLQLYTYPKNFNSFSTPKGYAIVELQDSDGKPVIADKDINISLSSENPDVNVNTSNDFEEVNFDKKNITIKKGEYLAYTKFTPRPDLGRISQKASQTYNISLSAENFKVKGDTITVTHQEIGLLEGKGPAKIDVVPFLTTGKTELIGVVYFETDITVSERVADSEIPGLDVFQNSVVTVPVMANENYKINVQSSHLGTVKTNAAEFKKGDNAALIFGQTGTFMNADGDTEIYVSDNDGVKTVIGKPEGPIEDNLSMVTESLIPKIMADTNFPIIAYMNEAESSDETTNTSSSTDEKENGRIGITPFIGDTVLTISADDNFEAGPISIQQNQPYAIIDTESSKVGSSDITVQTNDFDSTVSLTSYTTDPTFIHLSYADNVLAGTKSLATIQLLDSSNRPVYLKQDYEIKLVSNDKDVISIPDKITINSGEYYTSFDIIAKKSGSVEIAALSEDLPLAKFDIESFQTTPIITLTVPESVLPNERIEGNLEMKFDGMTLPLNGYSVDWEVSGAEIKQMDKLTDENGIATINVIANDPKQVVLQGTISGELFSNSVVKKSISIEQITPTEIEAKNTSFDLSGMNLIFLAIPGAAGGAFFYLRKTNRLESITENLNITDRINGVKDRIIELKSR